MPKRVTSRKVATPKAQGKDSWVVFKPVTYGERLEALELEKQHANDDDAEWRIEAQRQMYADHILDWNWVDGDDQPLPLPKDDPDVINGLTDVEQEALDALFGDTDPKL